MTDSGTGDTLSRMGENSTVKQSASLRHSGVVAATSSDEASASRQSVVSDLMTNGKSYSRRAYTITSKIEEMKIAVAKIEKEFESLDDYRDRFHLLTGLLLVVEDLWECREQREPEFANLLNLINIVLRKTEFEVVSKINADGLAQACRVLTSGIIDDEDVGNGLKFLVDSGLNPFEVLAVENN